MIGESLKNKIVKIALDAIDDKLGKRFPIIDEITDVFQEQDKRFKDIERELSALKQYVKENDEQTCCCDKKDCC
jgi:hypothetical protein|tara:strand:- start:7 stop:228 length:222 start_codon:yes stop_codon:yes gene_type:complete